MIDGEIPIPQMHEKKPETVLEGSFDARPTSAKKGNEAAGVLQTLSQTPDKRENARDKLDAISGDHSSAEPFTPPQELPTEQKLQVLLKGDPDFIRGETVQRLQHMKLTEPDAQALISQAYDNFKLRGSSTRTEISIDNDDSKQQTVERTPPVQPKQREEIHIPKEQKRKETAEERSKRQRTQAIISSHDISSPVAPKALGIAADATEDQIKEAYRTLARKYHPDAANKKDDNFSNLTNAYNEMLQQRKPKPNQPKPSQAVNTEPIYSNPPSRNEKETKKSYDQMRQRVEQDTIRHSQEYREYMRSKRINYSKEMRKDTREAEKQSLSHYTPDQLVERASKAENIKQMSLILDLIKQKASDHAVTFPDDISSHTAADIQTSLRQLESAPRSVRETIIDSITSNKRIQLALQHDLETREECFDMFRSEFNNLGVFRVIKDKLDKLRKLRIDKLSVRTENQQQTVVDLDELEDSVIWFRDSARNVKPEEVHTEVLRLTPGYNMDVKMYYVIRETVWTDRMRNNNPIPIEIRDRYAQYVTERKNGNNNGPK